MLSGGFGVGSAWGVLGRVLVQRGRFETMGGILIGLCVDLVAGSAERCGV